MKFKPFYSLKVDFNCEDGPSLSRPRPGRRRWWRGYEAGRGRGRGSGSLASSTASIARCQSSSQPPAASTQRSQHCQVSTASSLQPPSRDPNTWLLESLILKSIFTLIFTTIAYFCLLPVKCVYVTNLREYQDNITKCCLNSLCLHLPNNL